MNMKKILTVALVGMLLIGFTACGGDTQPSVPETSQTVSGTPSVSSSPSVEGTVGWWSDDIDHFSRAPYKVVYLVATYDTTMARMDKCYEAWAKVLNWDYTCVSAENDGNTFLTLIETYASQEYDGFIFDLDPQYSNRTYDLFNELGITYMADLMPFYDEATGKYLCPTITRDFFEQGALQADWCLEAAKTAFGDVDASKIGVIYHDMTESSTTAQYQVGFSRRWDEISPGTGYFTTNFDHTNFFDSAYTQTTNIITANRQYEYWVMASCMDFFSQGAARAITDLKLDDKCVMISTGGITIQQEWDTGYDGCWKAGMYTYEMFTTEAQTCGLTAMMDGRATMETLWSDYIQEGQTYATLYLDTEIITKDSVAAYMDESHRYSLDYYGFDAVYDMTQK
jgi:ABC-type sugar transport system substrate-binding protein